MSRHESRIRRDSEGGFYALVVRIDRDGQESVDHAYKGRHFSTEKAATRSTTKYIAKLS